MTSSAIILRDNTEMSSTTCPETHMGNAKWNTAPSECLAWAAVGLGSVSEVLQETSRPTGKHSTRAWSQPVASHAVAEWALQEA